MSVPDFGALDRLHAWMREHGASSVELHHDGSVKAVALGAPPPSSQASPPVSEDEAAAIARARAEKLAADEEAFQFAASEGFPPGWTPS